MELLLGIVCGLICLAAMVGCCVAPAVGRAWPVEPARIYVLPSAPVPGTGTAGVFGY